MAANKKEMALDWSMLLCKFIYDPGTGILFRRKATPKRSRIAGTASGRYRSVKIGNDAFSAHRLIWFMQTGEWPDTVDHINGDSFDNRWHNLRNVSIKVNCRNRPQAWNNTSGITGVSWVNTDGRWYASIYNDAGNRILYRGNDFFEACCCRRSAENSLGYHRNHGRAQKILAGGVGL